MPLYSCHHDSGWVPVLFTILYAQGDGFLGFLLRIQARTAAASNRPNKTAQALEYKDMKATQSQAKILAKVRTQQAIAMKSLQGTAGPKIILTKHKHKSTPAEDKLSRV